MGTAAGAAQAEEEAIPPDAGSAAGAAGRANFRSIADCIESTTTFHRNRPVATTSAAPPLVAAFQMMQEIKVKSGVVWEWLRENAIVVTFIVGQSFLIVGWGISQELTDKQQSSDIQYLRESDAFQKSEITRLDERGSRSLPAFEQRLLQHEALIAAIQKSLDNINGQVAKPNPVEQIQIENLKEQQSRIIMALDNVYNLLNEHLREDRSPLKNSPIQLPKSRPNIPLPQ